MTGLRRVFNKAQVRLQDGTRMNWIAELMLGGAWSALPHGRRAALAARIRSCQGRATFELPRTPASVYCFSGKIAAVFEGTLAPDSQTSVPLGKTSLLSTCRNEEAVIEELLESIAAQTLHPDEVVLCDGGSTDKTLERIEQWRERNAARGGPPFALRVIAEQGLSISAGRNRAAREASGEIFYFTDAGARLDKHWMERLSKPFRDDPAVELSMGWYKAIASRPLQRALARYLLPQLESVDPELFLPSGRSLAVRRKPFFDAGGYPEHLTLAGEDSLFDVYVKSAVRRAAFVPEAVSYWRMPETIPALARTIFRYAKGDAESGVLFWSYYLSLLSSWLKIGVELGLAAVSALAAALLGVNAFALIALICGLSAAVRWWNLIAGYNPFDRRSGASFFYRVVAVTLLTGAQAAGFLRGLSTFKIAEARRVAAATRGHLVLLATHPLTREGELDEPRRLLEQGWYLTVVYPQQDASSKEEMLLLHPQLEQHLRAAFSPEQWLEKHRAFLDVGRRAFIVEDRCRDALSADLARRFTALGARAS